ncbi:alpha/beta hydrolase [Actinoplanes sp. NPDC051851]|uniref:alpha/beta hydrolase n=1 Tax=Actinoplanes sp. NPDC051851 TaxID=3154753 RepID=UPI0034265841
MRLIAIVAGLSLSVAPAVPASPGLDWGECSSPATGVSCATLTLPVDWDDPRQGTFGLAVAKREARVPAERVGTLVFGPGGPGDSGVSRVLTGSSRFSAEILDRFDIVGFDPRTVGHSAAPDCEPDAGRPPVILRSQDEFDAAIAANRAYWQRCRESSALFDHADSVSAARDLDALRRALGEERLTFHGSSYGTLLGEMYAERYPGHVRAIVLESVFDHDLPLTDFVRTEAAGLQDSFDEFVSWCDSTDCLGEDADVPAIWADVLARAETGEYAPNTVFEIATLPLGYLSSPSWTGLADQIAALRRGEVPDPPDLSVAEGILCADFPAPVRDYRDYRRLLDAARSVAPDVRYGAGMLAVATCLGWPRPLANPPHRLRVSTATPLLLLNAVHDPRTPYAWATHVAAELGPGGRLVTYAGWGHGSYRETSCTIAAVDRYLVDLTVPPPGTTCPAAE